MNNMINFINQFVNHNNPIIMIFPLSLRIFRRHSKIVRNIVPEQANQYKEIIISKSTWKQWRIKFNFVNRKKFQGRDGIKIS